MTNIPDDLLKVIGSYVDIEFKTQKFKRSSNNKIMNITKISMKCRDCGKKFVNGNINRCYILKKRRCKICNKKRIVKNNRWRREVWRSRQRSQIIYNFP